MSLSARKSKSLRTFVVECVGPLGTLRINLRKVPNKASARRIFLNTPECRRRMREVGIRNAKDRKGLELTISRICDIDLIVGLA